MKQDKVKTKMLIGAIERCDLPDLDIIGLEMRVDTGAKTSSLHVDNIVLEERDGEPWVVFDIHPDVHHVDRVVRREAKLIKERVVKTSNDQKERRVVIETMFRLGEQCWPIELNLTDRSNMTYLMLLGREAMKGRVLVDPGKSFLLG
ncbi:MAG: ATP-dependent zinc protease [Oleiphilus sp.]|nr:MAG: ATP-dependent zinc protease [Oleiphilus sp.]